MDPRYPVRPVEDQLPEARVTPGESLAPTQPTEDSPAIRSAQAIYVLFGIVIALLILRVALKALAANSGAAFTGFAYGITSPLVAPFQGIFSTPTASSGGVFEFSSVIAIVVYALIAWAIVRLIVILGPRRRTPTTV